MNKDIKVIVFDLDGTLYEDTHHFDFYANRLCEKLDSNKQQAYMNDYQAIINGVHPLKMGMAYDVKNDLILKHHNSIVEEVYRWDGTVLSHTEIIDRYKQPLQFNFHTLLNIGDLWWVPAAVASHYGITTDLAGQSFMETREYMMTQDFIMKDVAGFKEVLQALSTKKKLVLLTNSPQKDSEVILAKLGFSPFFAEKIFNGEKPLNTKHHLQYIRDKYDVGYEQILCVGDNAINEIIPAQSLGCRTILIDPHGISKSIQADNIVKSLSELVDQLKNIER